jgi:hypothetical protein
VRANIGIDVDGLELAHALAFEFDPVGVVDDASEDSRRQADVGQMVSLTQLNQALRSVERRPPASLSS